MATTQKIQSLIDDIQKNRYFLPEFQRGFRWNSEHVRQEFSTEWYRFQQSDTVSLLTLTLQKKRFPFLFQSQTITITSVEVFALNQQRPLATISNPQSNNTRTEWALPVQFTVGANLKAIQLC